MKMRTTHDSAASIGNTPLIRLRGPSDLTGCDIFGKAEYANPGGSVKDRTALGIVETAQAAGEIESGGLIVEGTAGNTGIGLAVVGNARGFRTVIVMPETQSQEKIETLRLYGAEVRLVPAAKFSSPNHYTKIAAQLAANARKDEPHGVLFANQFDNTANRDIHARTTGQEIWEQTAGDIDGFVAACGTGGTLAGVAQALREKHPGIKIALADPAGSALYKYYTTGKLESEGSSMTEGIGNSRITANLEGVTIDFPYSIPDTESLPIVFKLIKEEGLLLGGSSGVNVAGAIRLARELGPGHTIVTVLCDGGIRYRSRLFNPDYLKAKGLPCPDWRIN